MLTLTVSLLLGGLLAEPGPRSTSLLAAGDRLAVQTHPAGLPSLAPPIVVLAGGLAAGAGATVLLSLAFSAAGAGPGVAFLMVAGFLVAAVGVGLLIIGAALLASTLDARHEAALEFSEHPQPASAIAPDRPSVLLARF